MTSDDCSLRGGILFERSLALTLSGIQVYDFPTALLFSIETQQTIGYGYRCMNPECAHAIVLVMFQSCFGIITQALMTGLVFAKLSRPKKRAQTLLFSKRAVICPRDGQPYLLIRVGDMRKSHIVEAQIRVLLVSKRVTREGEVLPVYHRELALGDGSASEGAGESEGRLFLVWPVIVQHCINDASPLWDLGADDLAAGRRHFEIIVILEGIVESTGMTTQARTSYLPGEVLWGHRFERLLRYRRDDGMYLVDYAKFHQTVPITETSISRDSAEQQAAARAGAADNVDDDSSSSTDVADPEHCRRRSERRRFKRRRRKLGRGSPGTRREEGDGGGGTTSTRSGSPSTVAGAAHMLQLAVGRSPGRTRRSLSPPAQRTRDRLTNASLAAFDLSPDLDDTAAAAVHAGDLLDPAADFGLSSFDLQT